MGATLVLVRHGQTEWSLAGRHTGRTDIELTAAGEATAKALAPALADVDFDLVLTSPRLRARRTAALAGFTEATVEDDLAEWDYGDYEGLTTPQIRESVPGWTIWDHPVPGGETPDEVGARLDRVVERVRATGGRVLVFAPVQDGRIFDLDTATYSVLGDDRGQPVVQRWNVGPTL